MDNWAGRKNALHCMYCGNEFWLTSLIVGDPDFCGPAHREKYNQRLQAAIRRINDQSTLRPAGVAGYCSQVVAHDRSRRSTLSGPLVGAQKVRTPRLCLARVGEIAPSDSYAEMPLDLPDTGVGGKPAGDDVRFQRACATAARLREEAKFLRRAAGMSRALTSVIELEPACGAAS